MLVGMLIVVIASGERATVTPIFLTLLIFILGWRHFWLSFRVSAASITISETGVEVKFPTSTEFFDWNDVHHLEIIRETGYPETMALIGSGGQTLLALPADRGCVYLIEAFAETSGARLPVSIVTPGVRPKWMTVTMWAIASGGFAIFLLALIPADLTIRTSDPSMARITMVMLQAAAASLPLLCVLSIVFTSPRFQRLRTPVTVATEVPGDTLLTLQYYSLYAKRLQSERRVFRYREPAAAPPSKAGRIAIAIGVTLILALQAMVTRNIIVVAGTVAVLCLLPLYAKLLSLMMDVHAPPDNCEMVTEDNEISLYRDGKAIANMDLEQFFRLAKNDRPWKASDDLVIKDWRRWEFVPEPTTSTSA